MLISALDHKAKAMAVVLAALRRLETEASRPRDEMTPAPPNGDTP
jgi:hypothetical protein